MTLLSTLAMLIALATLVWLASVALENAGIADPFWGAGFVVVGCYAWWLNAPLAIRPLLLVALTTIWGLRLSVFLLWRNWGEPEDRRYASMRRSHGSRFWWVSLFTVFWLQAAILWFVSLPVQTVAVQNHANPLGWLDALGLMVWGVGLLFESVADWELARFRANPFNANRVMDRGLWRYTRHPNYFGDFCVWWGIFLIAVAGGAWATALSPVVMSILLLKISGVTLLESTIVERRPEYAAYKARTSAFFPLPPRSVRS